MAGKLDPCRIITAREIITIRESETLFFFLNKILWEKMKKVKKMVLFDINVIFKVSVKVGIFNHIGVYD